MGMGVFSSKVPPSADRAEPPADDESEAQALAEESEYGPRHPVGFAGIVIPFLAALWSLFQLSLPYLRVNSDMFRTVHLTFALALVYLSFPALRRIQPKRSGMKWLAERQTIPFGDYLLALAAAISALYYVIDYDGIAVRQGMPDFRDYLCGIALILLLLEGSRRALGPALPAVASAFILLCFVGERLPGMLAFKNVSPGQLLTQLTMTGEGIYGVPLYVSANMVFLFVLFGAMLEKSGGGHYFVQLAFCLLGRFRGGPAKAAVLASGLTGLVSGSSIANTVTTGTFTIPLMKKSGYPPEKAAAIEVAASTNGQLMPPIMGAAAFIIAERCGIEYLAVVKAAFIPAVISYLALLYITHLEAAKLGLRGLPPDELPPFLPTLLSGCHFLVPLILMIVLLALRFSPELAAFWSILVLALMIMGVEWVRGRRLGRQWRRSLYSGLSVIVQSLVTGGKNMMGIGVAVAAAGIIVGIMTLGPGGRVIEAVNWLSGGHLVPMLVITAVISLLLGMGLPTTANYIVVSTVVAPAILLTASQANLAVPLVAVHLYCFFFGILADDTPPVGLAAYAASAIARSRPIATGIQGFVYDLRTAILPFMFFFNPRLLLIGVHSVFEAVTVFLTGMIAMFSFASVVQGWLVIRNRWYETLFLILAAVLILRPRLISWGGPATWYTVGVVIYGGIALNQYYASQRGRRPDTKRLKAEG